MTLAEGFKHSVTFYAYNERDRRNYKFDISPLHFILLEHRVSWECEDITAVSF